MGRGGGRGTCSCVHKECTRSSTHALFVARATGHSCPRCCSEWNVVDEQYCNETLHMPSTRCVCDTRYEPTSVHPSPTTCPPLPCQPSANPLSTPSSSRRASLRARRRAPPLRLRRCRTPPRTSGTWWRRRKWRPTRRRRESGGRERFVQ